MGRSYEMTLPAQMKTPFLLNEETAFCIPGPLSRW